MYSTPYLGKIQLFIIAMKNSTAIEPTPTLKESIEGRERRPQDSKISYSKGYIRIVAILSVRTST